MSTKKKTQTNKQATPVDVVTVEPTYVERADQMAIKERAKLCQGLQAESTKLAKELRNILDSKIRGINVAREIGRHIELYTGHEKLKLPAFEAMSVSVHKGLPDATLDFAKHCLSLHQKYADKITDVSVALAEWEYVEELLLNIGASDRGGQQLRPFEPVKKFLSRVVRVKSDYLELKEKFPIANWEPFFLKSFITEAQPIADLVAEAKKLQPEDVK